MSRHKIIWTDQAKTALKDVFNFYKFKSTRGAQAVKTELLNCPKTILFAKQYQIDDINPKYRRIVVRDYKVLYREEDKVIFIVDIVSTRQSPDILKEK